MAKNYTVEETKQLILNRIAESVQENNFNISDIKDLGKVYCMVTQAELTTAGCSQDYDKFPEDIGH